MVNAERLLLYGLEPHLKIQNVQIARENVQL